MILGHEGLIFLDDSALDDVRALFEAAELFDQHLDVERVHENRLAVGRLENVKEILKS